MKTTLIENAPSLPIEIVRKTTSLIPSTGGLALVFYRPESGEIVQTAISSPDSLGLQTVPGCTRLQAHADVSRDYVDVSVDPPVVRPRPVIESLSALPIPCTVTVRCLTTGTERTYEVDDGCFEYSDLPGRYRLTAKSWPYHDAIFEVEV